MTDKEHAMVVREEPCPESLVANSFLFGHDLKNLYDIVKALRDHENAGGYIRSALAAEHGTEDVEVRVGGTRGAHRDQALAFLLLGVQISPVCGRFSASLGDCIAALPIHGAGRLV